MGKKKDIEYLESKASYILDELRRGVSCFKICRVLVGLGWLFVPCLLFCRKISKSLEENL